MRHIRSAASTAVILLAAHATPNAFAAAAGAAASSAEGAVSARAPQIVFEKLEHDFGAVWDFERGSAAFRFVNTGDETLEILTVKAACGCTTTELARTTFAPGEGESIDVQFDPKGRGSQRKTITVVTNAGPPIVLAIRADVRPFLAAEPSVVQFGDIEQGTARRQRFVVRAADPNFVLDSVTVLGRAASHVTARVVPSAARVSGPLPPGQRAEPAAEPGVFTIEVSVADGAPWGQLFASLDVVGRGKTPDEASPTVRRHRVTVAGRVFGEVIASDTMVRVSRVPAGKPFTRIVEFRSRSGRPLPMLDATLLRPSVAGMTVTLEPVPGTNERNWKLEVTADPRSYVGRVSGSVIVRTGVPGEERLMFSVAGMVAEGG